MTTLFDLFDSRPHFRTDRLAMSMRAGLREERWSYAKYRQAVDCLAGQFLTEWNFSPGDRVIIQTPNSPTSALALHALMRSGLVAVPIDMGATPAFAAMVAETTQARAILAGVGAAPLAGCQRINLSDLRPEGDTVPDYWPKGDGIAEIVFTSGTTGTPKGVVLTHGNLAANLQSIISIVPENEVLRLLSVLPLSHMFEQTVGLAMPLFLGGSVHYVTGRQTPVIHRALRRHSITCMVLVPQMLDLMYSGIERKALKTLGWPGWERSNHIARHLPLWARRRIFRKVIKALGGHMSFFMCGGAYLSSDLNQAWETLGIRILEGYGTTECSPVIASNTIYDRMPGSVGSALPGVDLRISSAGEVQVRGESVFSEYWHNPDGTREAFTADGWFRTGDLAGLAADGRLTIRGRLKDMISLPSGMNVYPEDVEKALSDVPGIDDCAVVGVADALGGVRVNAVLCSKLSDRDLESAVLSANKHLAEHQRISAHTRWLHDELPKTALLKVKRAKVREILETGERPPDIAVSRRSEDRLRGLVASICKCSVDEVRNDSDLRLDLNLDSLKMVELAGSLEIDLGVALEESELAEIEDFAALSSAVEASGRPTQPLLFPNWPRSHWGSAMRHALQLSLVSPLHSLFARSFDVLGGEKTQKIKGPCLFVANHSSHVDTISIIKALPTSLRATTAVAAASDYFFKNRIVSPIVSLALNIFPFSRSGNIRESLEFCGDLVDQGWSILIYPEGTRSPTGKLLPFKPGIGLLATGLSIPIVPIAVSGGHEILPKGSCWPRRARVSVAFGPPLNFGKDEPPDRVTQRIQEAVGNVMATIHLPGTAGTAGGQA